LKTVVEARSLSKWYGNILGISDITLEIVPGIIGLLGPNGAGKSTFLKLMVGQLRPNIGTVEVLGEPVFANHTLFKKIGFCPEFDCYFHELSAWRQIVFLARLHGVPDGEVTERAQKALEMVGLLESRDRLIREFSLGMRQRLKFAIAVVHEPEVLILDEPLRGIDPLWRMRIIEIIKRYAAEGKTVIVASHILPEIEALTEDIILIHQGKVFAQGNIQYIRDLIDSHPHMVSIGCEHPRQLAALMVGEPSISNIRFEESEKKVVFNTDNRDRFFNVLNRLIVDNNVAVEEILAPDDNLQAVFDYLVEGH